MDVIPSFKRNHIHFYRDRCVKTYFTAPSTCLALTSASSINF